MRKGVSRIITGDEANRNDTLEGKVIAAWKKSVYGKSLSPDAMKLLASVAISTITR